MASDTELSHCSRESFSVLCRLRQVNKSLLFCPPLFSSFLLLNGNTHLCKKRKWSSKGLNGLRPALSVHISCSPSCVFPSFYGPGFFCAVSTPVCLYHREDKKDLTLRKL